MSRYAIINDEEQLHQGLELCKGAYQRCILLGLEAISGATLKGRAKNYSNTYKQSAEAIISRCQKAGLNIRIEVGKHNKRLVVIG